MIIMTSFATDQVGNSMPDWSILNPKTNGVINK